MVRVGGVLAIDFGEKKTGFAGADPLRIAVRALGVCRHGPDCEVLYDHVSSLLAERDVDTLLVGRPLHMDGTVGERARAAGAFATELARRFSAARLVLYDERLTSKAAEDLLREAGPWTRDRGAAR